MTNRLKTSLLAATMIAGFAVTGAQAQVAIPAPGPNDSDNSLHGAGATSVQNVLVQELNCIGVDNQLGKSGLTSGGAAGSLATIPNGNFAPSSPTAANPAFNCANQNIQTAFSAKYVATGSGFGRQMWREYKADFDYSTAANNPNVVDGVYNPFATISGQAAWNHLQFAFSDTPISPKDLTAYNNGGHDDATGDFPGALPSGAGAAIQFPKYVLPIAIAYNPVYGINGKKVNMTFNVKSVGKINNVVAGGLRLPRTLYCGIFNGTVTNFNDAQFKTANSGVDLHDTNYDTQARWNADGVPIRLVGRLDRSGSTDVFTRHLAAVCGTTGNAYLQNAESLPYNPTSGVDLSSVRQDTGYQSANTNYPNASNNGTNLVSGTYFDGTSIKQQSGQLSATPTTNQGTGLFLTADGGSKLAGAINLAPDYALNGVTLNGKIGYISADFLANSQTGTPLFAAQLQVGTGTTYAMPSATNALLAFGSGSTAILPPQASSSGAFVSTDSRSVRAADGSGNVVASRDNPVAWTDVLYADSGNTLAAPAKGYAITGTTQFYGYTCYQPANRLNIVEFLALNFGKVTKDENNGAVSANTFKGTGATALGTLAQQNIGVVPAAWQTAITETFLKKSTQASNGVKLATLGNGGKGLYIQSNYALKAGDVDDTAAATDVQPNGSCGTGAGA